MTRQELTRIWKIILEVAHKSPTALRRSSTALRKVSLATLLLALFVSLVAQAVYGVTNNQIRLNTLGFLPDHLKRASIATPCDSFSVIKVDGAVAFRGKVSGPTHNDDTNEDLYLADFSALKVPGVYRLDVANVGQSPWFRIGRDLYDSPFHTAMQAMYLWRCGTAVHATHNGVTYSHAACHLNDALLDFVGEGHKHRDATKGWHDAGDYNKYVVNAGVTVGIMFLAWEQFGRQIQQIKLGFVEPGTPLPDYLKELKWEMDWLLTMQAPDGSVYHKISTKTFGSAILPEREQTERYFAPWSSAATADFVAMAAMAGRSYAPYDPQYARRCLDAARRSYDLLRARPESRANLREFSTGAYQTNDSDDRLWAAAEMWETTGDPSYLEDFESQARAFRDKISPDWGWQDVKNLGMITYLFSKRAGRDAKLLEQIRAALIATANAIVQARDAHGYARPLGKAYYWGCNGGVVNTTVLLQSANLQEPRSAYVETALDALGHLFGRNYYGRSFVTGLGANPPLHPHDRRSMGDPDAPTWPGYLVGGGWPKATDWQDQSERYQVNEIAINWNAPLIYALAGFVGRTQKERH